MEIGETLLVTTRQEWRDWLAPHHRDRKEIWLIYYKKGVGKTGISVVPCPAAPCGCVSGVCTKRDGAIWWRLKM